MSIAPLAIDIASVCFLAALLLHRYGNWRSQHIGVTLVVFIAWYFSLMIIFALPIDVSNTCYRQCIVDHTITTTSLPITTANPNSTYDNTTQSTTLQEEHEGNNISSDDVLLFGAETCKRPLSYVPSKVLITLWHVVYWTSQFLTWLLLPMMQSYATAGDFTVAGKIKTSLIENAIYYGSYLIIFGILLIYLVIRPDIHIDGPTLKVLGITASNTWGLFLLVLLLGYGLVEVPRQCWNNARRGYRLNYTHFKLAKLSVEKTEAEETLEDVMEDVKKASETIRYNHPLRKCVDTIIEKCPESIQESARRAASQDYTDYNPTETPTQKSLVRLHKKVIKALQTHRRTQCQWNNLLESALDLEDLSNNERNTNRSFVHSGGRPQGKFPQLEWYWKCWVKPLGLRILAVLLSILSIAVVWSECLFFVSSPVLSLFALFIDLAKDNYDYIAIEFVCFVTIAYLSWCAYYTVFKVRVFNYYYLASHHMTDEYSLIFCGMLLCRLTPPLCLNFLGLIHMDTHVTKQQGLEETTYTQIMGHMDVIAFISDGFNIYFPIAIVLLCFATLFRLGSRVLHCLGFQQFVGDDDITSELVDEGRNLVHRDRRRRERMENTAERRRDWNERFGGPSGSRSGSERRGGGSGSAALPSGGGSGSMKGSGEYGSMREPSINSSSETPSITFTSPTGNIQSGARGDDPQRYNSQPAATVKPTTSTSKTTGPPNTGLGADEGGRPTDVFSISRGRYTAPRSPQEHDTAGLLKEVHPTASSHPDPFLDDSGPINAPGSRYQATAKRTGPPRGIYDDI